MTFLTGLHGSVATLLICVLLYIDEAGVPLPLCPNELLLIGAGLLIASGAVPAVIFLPLALGAMSLGTFSGYKWADRIGAEHLQGIASKVGGGKLFNRTSVRMRNVSTRGIFVTRLIPGVRPYATLIAGATHVPLRRFMAASVAAIVPWMLVMTALGFFIGVPAEHFISTVEKSAINLAMSGGLLILLGVIAYRAATRVTTHGHYERLDTFKTLANRDRFWLAALVDFGVIATVTAGVDRITRSIGIQIHSPFGPANGGFIDVLTIVTAIALFYLLLSRHSAQGITAGERIFDITYIHTKPPERRARPRDRVALRRRSRRDRSGQTYRQPEET